MLNNYRCWAGGVVAYIILVTSPKSRALACDFAGLGME